MQFAQRHRLIVAALLAATCLALVVVWLAWPKSSSTPAATAAPLAAASPATSAPDWLVGEVQPMLNRYTGGKADAVSSLSWVKTTWGQYETAVDGGGDKTSVKPAYVVVAHGKFRSDIAEGTPIAVTTVVMTFDGTSQKLSTIDALYKASSFDEASLGELRSLSLPGTSQ
jgi:hypothetical protein